MIKKALMTIRTSVRLMSLLVFAIIVIISLFAIFYKPTYSVSINGEFIGYTKDKSNLQKQINEYMEKGDESDENIAFAQVEVMPQYELCLLKKGVVTNDEEIYAKVIQESTTYYRYYAILLDNEEKIYVGSFSEAEQIVEKLKAKNTNNIDRITIQEKYNIQMDQFASIDDAVTQLYEEKPVVVATTKKKTSTKKSTSSTSMSYQSMPINVSLIRPISGTITSRFGSISRVRSGAHKGLDIAAPKGTKIAAAASGTVTFSGDSGALGNLIIISHGDGVETYYGHCSKLYADVGQYVEQGEIIAAVGSTGNSTGPHLHLEVKVNGVAYNPQNYVY
ncbi:MAG: M23 family metallopeptidase [Clostridia bacterium]|nr:M23 family metallopeptidase [Clostridia bacterium]